MIYVIFAYVFAIVLAHLLLFLRSNDLGKIIVMNSAISCFAVAMSMLAFYFKDTNFVDVIFFYIIMSPIGFYGLFLYYKYKTKIEEQKRAKEKANYKVKSEAKQENKK